ncbi:MAG: hypothetical protein RLZZ297_340, partial [Chloroflexota bacterium]
MRNRITALRKPADNRVPAFYQRVDDDGFESCCADIWIEVTNNCDVRVTLLHKPDVAAIVEQYWSVTVFDSSAYVREQRVIK